MSWSGYANHGYLVIAVVRLLIVLAIAISARRSAMHLRPAAVESAIRLLETSSQHAARGDLLETEDPAIENGYR
jgi:hypothetical protein